MNNKFRNQIMIGGFIIIAILVGAIYSNNEEDDVQVLQDTAFLEVSETETNEENIYVYVLGAVHRPGVIEVSENSRVFEVIEHAGGTTNLADLDKINLASIVQDEEKIIIPFLVSGDSTENINEKYYNSSKTSLININSAEQSELEKLAGIGESTAKKIIEFRRENGRFKEIDDIMNVSGIGESKFNAIKNDITVWACYLANKINWGDLNWISMK